MSTKQIEFDSAKFQSLTEHTLISGERIRCHVSVSGMLRILKVSRSGYLAFLNRKALSSRQRKESVKKDICKTYDKSRQNYGAPKITQEGFAYLSSVMDLYSRKIIAWTLSDTLEGSTAIDTISKAKDYRDTELPLIIHSDRGSQYVSEAWRRATESMENSYSKKAFPYDNVCIESFHSLIKREWLNRFRIRDFNQARTLAFEYIETFYNTVRIHSHCDYLSPDEYEKLYEKEKGCYHGKF